MKITEIDLNNTNRFSDLFINYIQQSDQRLTSFYNQFPSLDNFESQIKGKNFPQKNRDTLVEVLNEQYQGFNISEETQNNIESLSKENTFTVTTGHQLNIFTGPLYFIYKIITVINACKELKQAYPTYNFVPVYWMASEDHDFEEIDHFNIEGKKYTWKTEQGGAVGRFNTLGLTELAKQVPGMPNMFLEAYHKSNSLAQACRYYVNELFGDEGIVVLDADHTDLKSLFGNVIKDDILNNSSKSRVDKSTEALEQLGYKTQVYARPINFFYLANGIRERIEKTDSGYQVLNTEISFSENDLKEKIDNNPEYFSPNVILRPLYQEMILPNLAYVGGPSEVAYWFQLKEVFDYHKVLFPLLMPRNFAALVTSNVIKKVEKTGLKWEDFFKPAHTLHKEVTLKESSDELELNGQVDRMIELFNKVKEQAANIDQTLIAHVEAQATITKNRLMGIEKKFIRAAKKNHAEKINQIDYILDNLFPGGTLQERRENFISFYLLNHNLIDELINHLDPFNYKLYILKYA